MANYTEKTEQLRHADHTNLPAVLTRQASKQTYYTIRFLVDRDRVNDAYRAYAYFRWVDDQLDCGSGLPEEKKLFLHRQQDLLDACYRRESPDALLPEEQMLADLVRHDQENESGLQIYLRNMMAVMAFDEERCGRVISRDELGRYSYLLSKAVTEAMFYFIGHQDPPPEYKNRYQAVMGAHVVHMLRDLVKDLDVGYMNIPAEDLHAKSPFPVNVNSDIFRKWVYERVQFAYRNLRSGKEYIAQVANLRCRLAGFAYLARFEWMIRIIERDNYCLRTDYPERKSFRAVLWILWRVLISLFNISWTKIELSHGAGISEGCKER
jgi:phytoene/squalene synthetase